MQTHHQRFHFLVLGTCRKGSLHLSITSQHPSDLSFWTICKKSSGWVYQINAFNQFHQRKKERERVTLTPQQILRQGKWVSFEAVGIHTLKLGGKGWPTSSIWHLAPASPCQTKALLRQRIQSWYQWEEGGFSDWVTSKGKYCGELV